jgi:type I restriction enzyme, S subunit
MIESTKKQLRLPESWASVQIREVIEKPSLAGKKIKRQNYLETGSLPVVDQGQSLIGGYSDSDDLKVNCKLPVVVFGDHTKAIKYIDFDFLAGADGIKVLEPTDAFDPKLFFYFLHAISLPDKGYARHFQFLEKSIIHVPPLPEQHRIVNKIEELFTQLDAGVEALRKAKVQLKLYRQAVLKAASEGKLTEEWRAQNKGNIEPAPDLLKQIRATEISKQIGWLPNQHMELNPLPGGWEYSTIGSVGEIVTGNTPSKKEAAFYGEEVPFFKPTDLNAGYYVTESQDGLSMDGVKHARLAPPKSILVTCIGATIGKTGLTRRNGAFNQQINAIIPYEPIVSEFIYYMCISPQFQRSIIKNSSSTTLPIINKSKFQSLPIPLPPLAEQLEIVNTVEHLFSIAEKTGQELEKQIAVSARIRSSILHKAFQGELVSQDPTDQPASKLLERIRAERDKQSPATKNKTRFRNKQKTAKGI